MNERTNEQKRELFRQQKALLDTFLSTHAISKEQYEKSLNGLAQKMGFEPEEVKKENNSLQK